MDDNFIKWCKNFVYKFILTQILKILSFGFGVVFPYVQLFYEINFIPSMHRLRTHRQ